MADEGFRPCKLPKLKHEEDDLCYMGLNTEDYRELCDAVAVVCVDGHEHRLPVHSTELAKHSPVLLTACVVHKYSSNNVPLELRDPFQHGTLGGVELFLACCYQFHDRMRVLRDSLTDHPGGERVREAWRLAHALDAQQVKAAIAEVAICSKLSICGGRRGANFGPDAMQHLHLHHKPAIYQSMPLAKNCHVAHWACFSLEINAREHVWRYRPVRGQVACQCVVERHVQEVALWKGNHAFGIRWRAFNSVIMAITDAVAQQLDLANLMQPTHTAISFYRRCKIESCKSDV